MSLYERPGLRFKKSLFVWPSILLAGVLSLTMHVQAQTPAGPPPLPENVAAARELVQVLKLTDHLMALLPIIFQTVKSTVVQQGSADSEKAYDAVVSSVIAAAPQHVHLIAESTAEVFARNFSIDEIHDLVAFYRSATGQKWIERQPTIARENMAASQAFARQVTADLKQQFDNEMNKRDHAK